MSLPLTLSEPENICKSVPTVPNIFEPLITKVEDVTNDWLVTINSVNLPTSASIVPATFNWYGVALADPGGPIATLPSWVTFILLFIMILSNNLSPVKAS